jgi:signal transduction histidine kinase
MGSEYSHWLAVLAEPSRFPWTIGLMRLVALTAIGVSFKLLAMQIHERAQLQARVAAAERNSGMMKERQRLAREIHDTLAQGFAGIVVHLETAEQIDPLTNSGAKPHLDLARSVARENLVEARRMLAALRPEILEERGLTEALDRACHSWSARTGVKVTLSVTGDASPMHPEIELAILRAVQEALTNIGKHANAKTAAVTLSYMEDVVVLDVQDDGKGFTPEPKKEQGTGLGLKGMRERTEALRGTYSVESVPGEGTTVSITLPVVLTAIGESVPHGITVPEVGI